MAGPRGDALLTLLWGLESDEPLATVYEALRELGQDALLLDQRRVSDIEFSLEDDVNHQGCLRYGNRRVELEEIAAWYVRPYDTRRVAAVERAGPGSPLWSQAMRLDDALLGWLEVTRARVVNRPSAMQANGCKPYQLQLISQAGFAIPETLVTTDPAQVQAFCGRHGQTIYKSISGVRSQVTRLTPSDHEHLQDIVHCPTQFQEFIAGQDYRAHVVGESVFACEIRSDADDYRYGSPGAAPRIWATKLPSDIARRAVAMTKAMGLEVSGVDLRRTPQGQWYCFEVNPSPGFTYYEQFAGQALAKAIACHLTSQ